MFVLSGRAGNNGFLLTRQSEVTRDSSETVWSPEVMVSDRGRPEKPSRVRSASADRVLEDHVRNGVSRCVDSVAWSMIILHSNIWWWWRNFWFALTWERCLKDNVDCFSSAGAGLVWQSSDVSGQESVVSDTSAPSPRSGYWSQWSSHTWSRRHRSLAASQSLSFVGRNTPLSTTTYRYHLSWESASDVCDILFCVVSTNDATRLWSLSPASIVQSDKQYSDYNIS